MSIHQSSGRAGRCRGLRGLALTGVLLALAALAFGQAETGAITGTITDPSGAVVPNATVKATSVATQAKRTATTNSNGLYTLSALPPGQYDLSVSATNFAPFTRRVNVSVGSRNEISMQVNLASTSTTVEVVAGGGGTQVETQSSELSQVVNSQQVAQLPSLTRNPYDFAALSGNVAEDSQNPNLVPPRGANGLTINGQRASSTDILLDGAENVNLYTASVGQQVPLDSVQEFRVTTSSFAAEYGRASGGVVNVATKAGSNSLHGSAYEFNRLSALASNTFDNNANGVAKSPFTRNQFGYSLGGPIVKNTLFFFNSTEWTRVRSTANQLAYVLDPAFVAQTSANTQAYFNEFGHLKPGVAQRGVLSKADLVNLGIAGGTGGAFDALPNSLPVLDLVQYGVPTDVGGGIPQNTWNSVARVDYNLTDKTQMFGRYAVFHDNLFPGTVSNNAYAGFDTGQHDLNQNALFSITHIFSANLLSSTKLSFNRLTELQPINQLIPNLYYTLGGQVTINSQTTTMPGYLPSSTANSLPFGGPQNVAQIAQDMTWTRGPHQFKFGAQYVYTRDNRVFGAFEEGGEFLSKGNTANSFDALVSGTGLYRFAVAIDPQGKFPCFRDPATNNPIVTAGCTLVGPTGSPNFSRSNRYRDSAAYFQDTWKATNRLTLNLGLRWEYYGVQHDKHPTNDANFVLGPGSYILPQVNAGFVANGNNLPDGRLWNPQYANFAPRVGFAYDLTGDGKSSLRGGYGIAYERNLGNVTFNVIQNPPNYAVLNVTSGVDVPAGSIALTANNFGPSGQPGSFAFRSPTLRAVNRNIKTAYSHMWNLSLEHEVARNTVAALEYSGSRGLHGYSISNFNDIGMGANYLGFANPGQRPNLQYGSINYRTNGADSYHHALNARLQSSNLFNRGITLTANYTFAHTIDDLSATFGGSDELGGNTLGFLNPLNPSLDRGDADYDVRHRVVVSALWAVPFAKGTHGVLNQILDGWELAPIFNARTGYPYTIYDCTFAVTFNCPRYVPGGPNSLSGSTSTSLANVVGPNVFAYQTLAPPLAYIPSVTGNSGLPDCTTGACVFPSNMSSRNAFRQPGFWNSNLGLYKNFKVTERAVLQFRSEFYNLFNHSNYYVQTGALNNISGIPSDVEQVLFTNPSIANVDSQGNLLANSGGFEFVDAAGHPLTYQIQGKKGSPQGFAGSLGERRFIQFALKLTF